MEIMGVQPQRALQDAFDKLGLSATELEQRLSDARSVQYWRALNPALSINVIPQADHWTEGVRSVPREETAQAIQSYRQFGYLALSSVLSLDRIRQMRLALQALQAHDWPPVFAFVYDAFWCIGQARATSDILSAILGPGYRLLPRVWTHHVFTSLRSRGWKPHVDGRRGAPLTISIWVPLSNATLANGCMYVVKHSAVTDELSRNYETTERFSKEEVATLLSHTRALPCGPGGLLAWDQNTLHWGSYFESGSEPRISIALEFTSQGGIVEEEDGAVSMDGPLPAFSTRLRAIGKALQRYKRFEPSMQRFAALSEELCRQSGAIRHVIGGRDGTGETTHENPTP